MSKVTEVEPGHLVSKHHEARLYKKSEGAHFTGWVVYPKNRREEAYDRYTSKTDAKRAMVSADEEFGS